MEKMYKVDIDGNNKLHGCNREMFLPGEKVIFKVPLLTDVDTNVTSNGVVRLESDCKGNYEFIMPEQDVKIEITISGGMTSMIQGPVTMGSMGMGMKNMCMLNQTTMPPTAGQKVKYCPNCGAAVIESAKFCAECGNLFPVKD